MIRCGIDLGGTKIALICLDKNHKTVFEKRIPTPQGNYAGTLAAITQLVKEAEISVRQPLPVGIGTPGAISSATGMLKNSNSTCLNGKPLKQDLEIALGRKIKMSNDANCFALSEATDGAASGSEIVFGVIVGTGTGAGITVNQHVLNGKNSIAGEWGHNPMPWHDSEYLRSKPCYCGKTGCIETFLSGPGFEDEYFRATGKKLSSPEIIQNALQGDDKAESVVAAYERNMAKALAHVINILDPDVIVLGGGISNIHRLYTNVPAIWTEYVFSDSVNTQLLPPKFGDASGVRGAARLWEFNEL